MKDIDRRILKAVEEEQTKKEPFEHDIDGITYNDISDEFTNEDFDGIHPDARLGWRLWYLSEQGYLNRVYKANDNPHQYRLSDQERSM